jgi:hypothetical protein
MNLAGQNFKIADALKISVIILLLILPLQGCGILMPRTSAMRQIHRSYQGEFVANLPNLPGSPDAATSAAPMTANAKQPFAETLRQIGLYRQKHEGNEVDLAHLLVLEGMILLQTSRFEEARLLEPRITEVSSTLARAKGALTRDALFAIHFKDLLNGWSVIHQPRAPEIADILKRAALAIDNSLAEIAKSNPNQQSAAVDPDDARLYIATVGAIFYHHVGQILSYDDRKMIKEGCLKARDIMAPYLSDDEKEWAANDSSEAPVHRQRYLKFYRFFASEKCFLKPGRQQALKLRM